MNTKWAYCTTGCGDAWIVGEHTDAADYKCPKCRVEPSERIASDADWTPVLSDQATTHVRLLLVRMGDDADPCVVAAVSEGIWESWTDDEEAAWLQRGKDWWGENADTEFKVVIAAFSEQALADVFATPVIRGELA